MQDLLLILMRPNSKLSLHVRLKASMQQTSLRSQGGEKMDLYTQFAIVCAKEAIEDCGMTSKSWLGYLWCWYRRYSYFEEEVINYALQGRFGPKFNPFFIPK